MVGPYQVMLSYYSYLCAWQFALRLLREPFWGTNQALYSVLTPVLAYKLTFIFQEFLGHS